MSQALQLAVLWAAELHADQWRDGNPPVPYLCHPLEVLQTLRYANVTDEAILIAAVLHDVVEETPATLADVQARFGDRVAELVGEVTRDEPTPDETAGMDAEEIYVLRTDRLMAEIARMSPSAHAIKLADRLSNLREAKRTRPFLKYDRYLNQTRRMLEVIPESSHPRLWRKLHRKVYG